MIAGLLNAVAPGLGFLYLGRSGLAVGTLVAMPVLLGAFAWSKLIFVPAGGAAAVVLVLGLFAASIVAAIRMARRQEPAPLTKLQRWYIYLAYLVASSIVLDAVLKARGAIYGYETFRFPSRSMDDTLRSGDYFMSDTWKFREQNPGPGELVVFVFPDDPSLKYLKRVIGVPGDTVRIHGTEVHVNGKLLNEPYVNPANNRGLMPPGNGEFSVPEEKYFVLGDNRDNSSDSRIWGFVPQENMYGSVEYIWFSRDLSRLGLRVK